MVSAEAMGVEKVVAVKVAVVKAEVVMDLEAKAEEVRAVEVMVAAGKAPSRSHA